MPYASAAINFRALTLGRPHAAGLSLRQQLQWKEEQLPVLPQPASRGQLQPQACNRGSVLICLAQISQALCGAGELLPLQVCLTLNNVLFAERSFEWVGLGAYCI